MSDFSDDDADIALEIRVEARALFDAALIAHGHAMTELRASTDALAAGLERCDRARGYAERAGVMLVNAVKLMELRGAA